MKVKVYEYKKCGSCQKAAKFLASKNIPTENIPIIENPPSLVELKQMLGYLKEEGLSFKKLFNTSGELYRELKISEKLNQGMKEEEALQLLSKNGKLIKRPFVLTEKGGTVGFDEGKWKKLFEK